MSERDGIFLGDNPFALARAWLAEAEKTEINDPNAIALATADADGLPDVRVVLLKAIEDDGFVFFTNYESAKGEELAQNPQASFVMHWKSLRRQIRVRGAVEKLPAEASDAYYHSRALESRIGAWASQQSRPLESRDALMEKVAEEAARHGDHPARPPHWGGYKIRPISIEFWHDGDFRLHDRYKWTRDALHEKWSIFRLYP